MFGFSDKDMSPASVMVSKVFQLIEEVQSLKGEIKRMTEDGQNLRMQNELLKKRVDRLEAEFKLRPKTYLFDEKNGEHKAQKNADMPPSRDEVVKGLRATYGKDI